MTEAARLVALNPYDPYYLELEGQILLESGKVAISLPVLRRAVERAQGSEIEHFGLQHLQALIEAQHALAFGRQPGAAAALAADAAFHQRVLREVVQFVDGVPGRFVAQAGAFRRAGDRALFGDVLQQGQFLVPDGLVAHGAFPVDYNCRQIAP